MPELPQHLPTLKALDATRFPVIEMRGENLPQDGGVQAMIADFEALLAHGAPFAVLMLSEEKTAERFDHEEQKRWIIWLKDNRARLAAVCRGFVSVFNDQESHEAQQKRAGGMQAMLGIPIRLCENLGQTGGVLRTILENNS